MTGYGRSAKAIDGYEISFELKSVNNRFLDISVRMPRTLGYLEDSIKKKIGKAIARGKVDIFLTIERPEGEGATLVTDDAMISQYVQALHRIAETHGLRDDISVTALARFPDVFSKKSQEDDPEEMWRRIEEVAGEAIDAFCAMRRREGEALYEDLSSRLDTMEGIVEKIRALSGPALAAHRERLETKIREYVGDANMDEGRILTEVGILADKIDTGEEITRLTSHIAQFRKILQSDAPAGRTLDFLTQELNRETNTIGSKCNMLEITSLVIDAKNEIERIREQVQNIE